MSSDLSSKTEQEQPVILTAQDFFGKNGVMGYRQRQKYHKYKQQLRKKNNE